MSANWKSYPTADDTASACATHILSVLDSALSGGVATLAISGGSTPKLMFAHLAKLKFDWTQVHVFFVDERAVPPTHADSNYKMAEEFFFQPARVPQRNVHRIHAELPPEVAAKHYRAEIHEVFGLEPGELPHFDMIHLGIGSDAHTASLFPGEPLIEDREHVVKPVWVEKLNSHRITLLPGVLLSARHAAVLAAGEDKADAIEHILRGEYEPLKYPAQIVAHHSRRAVWFLDQAASARLSE